MQPFIKDAISKCWTKEWTKRHLSSRHFFIINSMLFCGAINRVHWPMIHTLIAKFLFIHFQTTKTCFLQMDYFSGYKWSSRTKAAGLRLVTLTCAYRSEVKQPTILAFPSDRRMKWCCTPRNIISCLIWLKRLDCRIWLEAAGWKHLECSSWAPFGRISFSLG